MKKIYLIDDNDNGQRALYGAATIDAGVFDDVLEHVEQVSPDDNIHQIVSEAACIMLHRTLKDWVDGAFVDGSNKVATRLKAECAGKVPMVLFSDGDSIEASYSEEEPNIIYSIKKSVFYERLIPFLDKYRQSGTINLEEIAFGANYKSQKAKELTSRVLSALATHSGDEKINLSWFEGEAYTALYDLVELSSPAIGLTFDEIMNDLMDNGVTVSILKSKINRILRSFNQNGENIYPWK